MSNLVSQDVVKSNALIEALYRPGSVYQMRLLMAALMQIKASESIDFRARYIITAESLSKLTGAKNVCNYKDLCLAADQLMNTIITVNKLPNGKKGNPIKTKINLVSSCEYLKGEGAVGLSFTYDIIPYISDLKQQFTRYQAQYVMPMRSSYGIRLYELCLQWLGSTRNFSVSEFKEMFSLDGASFDRIEVIKRRVITPALKDINTHSDINVTFDQKKSGRKVTHFVFKINKKNARKKNNELFKTHVEKHALPGESWDDAKKRLAPLYRHDKQEEMRFD